MTESTTTASTILLVEDEARVRAAVRRMLEALGHTVIEAVDGRDALRTLDSADEHVDLVLSDVMMPAMTGLELARHVLARVPPIPVLLMSGYAQDALDRDAEAMPDVPFMEKPFTFQRLAAAVESAMPGERVTGPQSARSTN